MSNVRVRLGDYNKDVNESPEQEFSIKQLIKHNWYRIGRHPADIALIKLDRPAVTTRYVQNICLPGTDTRPFNGSDFCYVTGWGDTRGTYQVTLHWVYDVTVSVFITDLTLYDKYPVIIFVFLNVNLFSSVCCLGLNNVLYSEKLIEFLF